MLPFISREGMIKVDQIMTEHLKIPVSLMMEQAGLNLAKIAVEYLQSGKYDNILIVVGSGNNGGGGLVAARRLTSWGYNVIILSPKGDPKSDLLKEHILRCKNLKIPIFNTIHQLTGSDFLVIDAYIGYNFKGDIRETDISIFQLMRDHAVISLDIPSGVDSTDGRNPGKINPLVTVTLAWPKSGFSKLQDKEVGQLYLVDIGVPKFVFSSYDLFEDISVVEEELKFVYQKFKSNSVVKCKFSEKGWQSLR